MAPGMHQHDTKRISIIAVRVSICGTREYPRAWETVDCHLKVDIHTDTIVGPPNITLLASELYI